MKQATQLALIGTIAMVALQMIGLLSNYFGYFGEAFYTVKQILDISASATLVNFFYKLYQKQNQKLQADDTNQFKE